MAPASPPASRPAAELPEYGALPAWTNWSAIGIRNMSTTKQMAANIAVSTRRRTLSFGGALSFLFSIDDPPQIYSLYSY